MHNEDELVRMSKNGDINAFEELVCRYERKIFTAAFRLIGNREDAADLAQEAFLRAFRSIQGFRAEASFLTWLYSIVTNLCRDELRKRARVQLESLDERITLDDNEVAKQFSSPEVGPAEVYEQKELQEKIQGLINTLLPEYRMALVLRDIQGFTYEEIAIQMECSLGTVKSRINRARNYLKDKLLAEREQNNRNARLYG